MNRKVWKRKGLTPKQRMRRSCLTVLASDSMPNIKPLMRQVYPYGTSHESGGNGSVLLHRDQHLMQTQCSPLHLRLQLPSSYSGRVLVEMNGNQSNPSTK